MPYGSAPYGAAPYGGDSSPDEYQAGDLLDEGEVGQPAIPETYQAGDLPDGGVVGDPILERDWAPRAPTPTVPPADVEANGERFPELAFEVVEFADHSHVCWLPLSLPGQTVRGARDDPGSITLEVSRHDPARVELSAGRMIRAWLRGRLIATALIEPRDDTTRQPLASREIRRVGGRGKKAYLEQIMVGPPFDGLANGSYRWFPHLRTHRFDWSHPALDPSSWPLARSKARQGTKSPHWTGYPRGWTDPDAHWMSGALGSSENAPSPLVAYLHLTYLLGLGGLSEDKIATTWTGDNTAEVVIDGVPVGETDDWQNLQQHDILMSEGVHRVRAKVRNFRQDVHNPMGLLITQRRITGQGKLGSVVMRTSPDPAFASNPPSYWRCLQNPSATPSWTPGGIIRYLLALAYLRAISEGGPGAVPNIVCSFNALTDSAGRRWPTLPDWSVAVGSNMLQVVEQFEESYIDCDMAAGSWTLHAWVKGSHRRSIDFDGLYDVEHHTVPPIATTLDLNYQDNWTRVTVDPPANYRRVEASLSIPQVRTEAGAQAIGRKVLANFGHVLTEYRAKLPPQTGWMPPLHMRHRDIIPMENIAGNDVLVRINAWTLVMDAKGAITPTIEAGDRVMQGREAIYQWLDRMADGALGGTTHQAAPQLVDTSTTTKRTRQTSAQTYQRDADITATTSHPLPIDNFSVLVDAQARLGEGEAARGSDTHCEVVIDGVATGDVCTIPAGQLRGRLVDLGIDLERDADVQLRIAQTGFAVLVVLRFT